MYTNMHKTSWAGEDVFVIFLAKFHVQCVTPGAGSPSWVEFEVALDGQIFTDIRTVCFHSFL